MRTRVFLDANVLFSASAKPDGVNASIPRLIAARGWVVVASGFVIDEARRNIEKKFPKAEAALNDLLAQIEVVPEASPQLLSRAALHLPAKDAPVLAAAMSSKAHILVTGDVKHFGGLVGTVVHDSVLVLSPRMTVEYVLASG